MPDFPTINQWAKAITQGDRALLGRGISLIESRLLAHQDLSDELLQACYKPTFNTFRIGITGVPGAGKSTFIEQLGLFICNELEQKVAVLAIDPSSPLSGGSILGDKTRMNDLARHPLAFIRPSPSSGSLGGVARRTLETIMLCEAAGYHYVFIETVGVGQSEALVKQLSDVLLLLLITGAGDQLQGIKRGIMELADIILINKADGDNAFAAKRAKAETQQALSLFVENNNGWKARVDTMSSLQNTDMPRVWNHLLGYFNTVMANNWYSKNRKTQAQYWLKTHLEERALEELHHWLLENPELVNAAESNASPFHLSLQLFKAFKQAQNTST